MSVLAPVRLECRAFPSTLPDTRSAATPAAAQVKAALALWDGTGSFVFTSSMSVCAVDDGGRVTDEQCPLVPVGAGPPTDRLLGAEQAVLQVRGAGPHQVHVGCG